MTDLITPDTPARTGDSRKKPQFVTSTVRSATGHWPFILETLGISTSAGTN